MFNDKVRALQGSTIQYKTRPIEGFSATKLSITHIEIPRAHMHDFTHVWKFSCHFPSTISSKDQTSFLA